jgi:hypothetical protein
MDQIPNYGDERQLAGCVHCAGRTESRDHIPAKVLLDDPLPENLPILPSCTECNRGASKDEEYLACLIDCVVVGSATPRAAHRPKVRKILERSPALAARIAKAQYGEPGNPHFSIEAERVRKVVIKLARGHAAFELNEPQHDEPSSVSFSPLSLLSDGQREAFESSPASSLWPEVGSRAMQRAVEAFSDTSPSGWITVQSGRYRYLAAVGEGTIVRIVLSEYLGCEVRWDCE